MYTFFLYAGINMSKNRPISYVHATKTKPQEPKLVAKTLILTDLYCQSLPVCLPTVQNLAQSPAYTKSCHWRDVKNCCI